MAYYWICNECNAAYEQTACSPKRCKCGGPLVDEWIADVDDVMDGVLASILAHAEVEARSMSRVRRDAAS